MVHRRDGFVHDRMMFSRSYSDDVASNKLTILEWIVWPIGTKVRSETSRDHSVQGWGWGWRLRCNRSIAAPVSISHNYYRFDENERVTRLSILVEISYLRLNRRRADSSFLVRFTPVYVFSSVANGKYDHLLIQYYHRIEACSLQFHSIPLARLELSSSASISCPVESWTFSLHRSLPFALSVTLSLVILQPMRFRSRLPWVACFPTRSARRWN